eukprot:scaffold3288_cov182-Skeletonema_marinoi.AAC.1
MSRLISYQRELSSTRSGREKCKNTDVSDGCSLVCEAVWMRLSLPSPDPRSTSTMQFRNQPFVPPMMNSYPS